MVWPSGSFTQKHGRSPAASPNGANACRSMAWRPAASSSGLDTMRKAMWYSLGVTRGRLSPRPRARSR